MIEPNAGDGYGHAVMVFAEAWGRLQVKTNDMAHDLTSPTEVAAYMRAATSRAEWNARCAEVQTANGGDYPRWWYETIIDGLVRAKAMTTWPDQDL
jgi:hypothetical protein